MTKDIVIIGLSVLSSLGLGSILLKAYENRTGKKREIEQHQRERKED